MRNDDSLTCCINIYLSLRGNSKYRGLSIKIVIISLIVFFDLMVPPFLQKLLFKMIYFLSCSLLLHCN